MVSLEDPRIHNYVMDHVGVEGLHLMEMIQEGKVYLEEIEHQLHQELIENGTQEDKDNSPFVAYKRIRGEDPRQEINKPTVRKFLYRLNELRLLSYETERAKARDGKSSSGTILFRWFLSIDNALFLIIDAQRRQIRDIEEKLEKESGQTYYICNTCGNRFNLFDLPDPRDLSCPDDGDHLEFVDNTVLLEGLEQELEALRTQLKKDEEIYQRFD